MNISTIGRFLLISTALGTAACANDDVNLGDGASTAKLGAALEDYAGTWEGYVEAYEFSDSSDQVRLTLDVSGNGHLYLGDTELYATPTDPALPFPPGSSEIPVELTPGLDYIVAEASVSSRRIHFAIDRFEPFAAYCSLLEPIEDPADSNYGCDVNGGSTWRDQNCNAVCACTETECTTYDYPTDSKFDAALEAEGEELNGTFALSPGERFSVRLTRTN